MQQTTQAQSSSRSGGAFEVDVAGIRAKARQDIESGAVTEGYRADREAVLKLLNEALATEVVCVLRYKRHYFMARGLNAEPVAAEFAEHAAEELSHADRIAERIVQLGGEPNLSPVGLLERSHSEYVEASNLQDMIKENLIAERIAIDSYRQMVDYVGDKDPTTRRLLEEILAVEEEHADDLSDFLDKN
ncbi:ferritin-like domain-containing protein [Bordetella genomosp. 2]|uniref:Bacterioferritin n=1 Tax=Bordetella genomosp. 2 TaxID=1983456 RepID=A0A261V6Y7_9BORD|nr:ferritin-like domain-containing protein [Bordetella genomosp. 2]OZI69581.1 bacterioferritin [Bordetella genomosp. 2]